MIVITIYFLFVYNGGIIFPDNQQEQTSQLHASGVGSVTYVTATAYDSDESNPQENINNISSFDKYPTTIIVGDIDNTLELTRFSI